MTIKASGSLSLDEINTEFGRGLNLNSYRGTKYYSGTTLGTFSSAAIDFQDFYGTAAANSGATVLFLTSGTSWTVPANWNDNNNKIEAIGGGASGVGSTPSSENKTGGGGGAYARVTNVNLTPGASVSYAIGAGGVGDTGASASGGSTTFTTILKAAGAVTRTGGTTANCIGDVKYAGGSAANIHPSGGGGAAGASAAGGTSTNLTGASGASGSWTRSSDGTVVSPGDGGNGSNTTAGVAGTLYGGGGGGTRYYTSTTTKSGTTYTYYAGGNGRQGIIIITYYALAV